MGNYKTLQPTDDACLKGTDLEEFCYIVNDIDLRTKEVVVRTDFVKFLHALYINEKQNPDNKRTGIVLSRESLGYFNRDESRLFNCSINKEEVPDELWEECLDTTKLIMFPEMHNHKRLYIIGKDAIPSMIRTTGIQGTKFVTKNDKTRNVFLADLFTGSHSEVKLICRQWEDMDVWKVFAFRSASTGIHVMIPQSTIADFILKLKENRKLEVIRWSITNRITEIYCELPENAVQKDGRTIMPGILFRTSDIGASSFRISGTIRVGGGEAVDMCEISQRHLTLFDANELYEEMKKRLLPELSDCIRQFSKLYNLDFDNGILNEALNFVASNRKLPRKLVGEYKEMVQKNLNMRGRLNMFHAACACFEALEEVNGTHPVTQDELLETVAAIPNILSAA